MALHGGDPLSPPRVPGFWGNLVPLLPKLPRLAQEAPLKPPTPTDYRMWEDVDWPIIIHEHTRVGMGSHLTVPVTAHCPALSTGNVNGRSVSSAQAFGAIPTLAPLFV